MEINILLQTRQQVDSAYKTELRRNYSSFFVGYSKVAAEGAGTGLYKVLLGLKLHSKVF